MRKIIAICLMTFSGITFGQVEIWACQAHASAGLSWDGARWKPRAFSESPYLIRIDGADSTYGHGETQYSTACSRQRNEVRCNDTTGGTILLNTDTGSGAISELLGAVVSQSSQRDALTVTAIQCTRF